MTIDEQTNQDLISQELSKSARKREATALQELGVQLAGLPDADMDGLDLPDDLHTALKALRRLSSRAAQVRQRQYIGKLMRNIDAEPILTKMAEKKRKHDIEIRHFQRIERWRDRLLTESDADALDEFVREYTQADRASISRLIAKALRERTEQRSPAGSRELFAHLRQLMG